MKKLSVIIMAVIAACLLASTASAMDFASDNTLEIAGTQVDFADITDYVCESPLGTPIACDGRNIIEYLPVAKYDGLDITRVWVSGDFEDIIYIIADSAIRYDGIEIPSAVELQDFVPADTSIGTPIFADGFGTHEILAMSQYPWLDIELNTQAGTGARVYTIQYASWS